MTLPSRHRSRPLRIALTFITVGVFFIRGSADNHQAPQLSEIPITSKVIQVAEPATDLLAQIEANGHISIIVGFASPSAPLNEDAAAEASQLAAINSQRDMLVASIGAAGNAQVISQSNQWVIPFVALDVDEAAYRGLLDSPQVTSISENLIFMPALTSTIPIIHADAMWGLGADGSGQTIAILDTGVDGTHSAFAGRIVAEACYSGSGGNPTLCPNLSTSQIGAGASSPARCDSLIANDDRCYHGTHVAGIAASNNPSRGIYGVARGANLISVQVFTKTSEIGIGSYLSDQISGLNYVYSLRSTYQIAAVNMSIAGGLFTSHCDNFFPSIATMFTTLRGAGIMPVVAAGNNGSTTEISAPACVSPAVSVGATTDADVRASYSNSLPSMLSLFAPGSAVYSTVPSGSFRDDGTGYGTMQGTSMASPHVTGAFAVLRDAVPSASIEAILDALRITGTPIVIPGGTTPRIDLLAAYYRLTGRTFTLTGSVTLQGRPAAPNAAWSVPLDIIVETTFGGIPVFDGTIMSNTSGQFSLNNVPAGTYTVWVKHDRTLAQSATVVVAGNTSHHFGTLLEGDANNENLITLPDFSILATTFGKVSSDVGYDGRADFNGDHLVSIVDFSLLASNFGQAGVAAP